MYRFGNDGAHLALGRYGVIVYYVLLGCVAVAVFASLSLLPTPAPWPYELGEAKSYPTGKTPRQLVTADFNGDGNTDLATVDTDSGGVTILLNDGKGNFTSSYYGTGAAPTQMTVIDFNNDGSPDLVVLNAGDRTVTLLENDGRAGFVTLGHLAVGQGPEALIARKGVTRSSTLETFIVVANGGDNSISYFRLDEKGNSVEDEKLPLTAHPSAVAFAQLKKQRIDGQDTGFLVVAPIADGTISLMSLGAGAPQPVATYKVGNTPNGVAAADFDEDGNMDLVVVNAESNNVSVLLGNGDLTLQPSRNYATGKHPDSVSVIDVNGDGRPDLIVNNSGDATISVLLNRGEGKFATAINYEAGPALVAYAYADIDGDDIPDLVVVHAGGVGLLKGSGDGTFEPLVAAAPLPVIGDQNPTIRQRRVIQVFSAGVDETPNVAVAIPAINRVAIFPNSNGSKYVEVIEYVHSVPTGEVHYLLTPVAAEIAALDAGTPAGWRRTGASFRAYRSARSGTTWVCRFFFADRDAHYYSVNPDECAKGAEYIRTQTPKGILESANLFYMVVPTADGTCPNGTIPVYQLSSPRLWSNHRFVTNSTLRDAMIAAGWIADDFGAQRAYMCAP